MSPDAAIALFSDLFRTLLTIAGPLLAVALAAGMVVGVIQTATQVNEASVSFVVKVLAVVAALLVLGPTLFAQLESYTRSNFEAVQSVVKR